MQERWTVKRHSRADKQIKAWKKGEVALYRKCLKLEAELKAYGQPQSQEFIKKLSKTKGVIDCWHCHIKGGQPTYVAVWSVCGASRSIFIGFVGTHEKVGNYVRYC